MSQNHQPDTSELRSFGLIMGAFLVLVFGVVLPVLLEHGWPWWPWPLALLFVLWALLWPAGLRPVYRIWMAIGLVLHRVITAVILGTVFFLVITPMGLVRRMMGHDSMRRAHGAGTDSYRVESRDRPKRHVERPF